MATLLATGSRPTGSIEACFGGAGEAAFSLSTESVWAALSLSQIQQIGGPTD